MKRRPPGPHESTSEGSDPDKPVGYGNPPRRTHFKPGQSGNRRGRPKRSADLGATLRGDLIEAMSRTHLVKDGGRSRKVTTLRLGVEQLSRRFAKGEARALRDLILLAEASGLKLSLVPADAQVPEIKPDHAAILTSFMDRYRPSQAAPPERVFATPDLLDEENKDDR